MKTLPSWSQSVTLWYAMTQWRQTSGRKTCISFRVAYLRIPRSRLAKVVKHLSEKELESEKHYSWWSGVVWPRSAYIYRRQVRAEQENAKTILVGLRRLRGLIQALDIKLLASYHLNIHARRTSVWYVTLHEQCALVLGRVDNDRGYLCVKWTSIDKEIAVLL